MSPEELPYIGIIDTVSTAEYRQAIETLKKILQTDTKRILSLDELDHKLENLGPALYAIAIKQGKKGLLESKYTYTIPKKPLITSLELTRD